MASDCGTSWTFLLTYFIMQTSKKGRNSAMTRPTEKTKYGSAYLSCLFHILNFKILSITVLDSIQSVTDEQTDGRTDRPNQYDPSTSSKLEP